MPRLDRLWYEIDAQTQGFDKGILQSQTRLESFTEYARTHPVAVLGALGVAATLAAAKLASMAAQFQHEMAKINTVLDTSQASLGSLADGIDATFTSMPIQNIEELTKGMYDIISSGVDAGKAVEFLGVASKAAVGGVTSVAVAVDGLTTAVNAFRGEGLTVARASDVMFQAVNKGKIEFAELSHAMGLGAAIAAGTGVKFTDLNAAVAQLSLGGLSAEMAMVGVRSAIVNILKPSSEFAQKFPEIAHEFNRAKLESAGFIGFLTELKERSKGNQEVFTQLFSDVQGFNAVTALMTDGGKAATKMLGDMEHSAGAADTAAAKMLDTTKATNDILKNQFSVTLRQLGNDFLPVFNDLLETAVFLMDKLGNSAERAHLKDLTSSLVVIGSQSRKGLPEDPGALGNFRSMMIGDRSEGFKDVTHDVLEFTNAVQENRLQLGTLSTQELKNVRTALDRVSSAYGNMDAATEETQNKITRLLRDRVREERSAANSAEAGKNAATASAVAFTEAQVKVVDSVEQSVHATNTAEEASKKYGLALIDLQKAHEDVRDAAAKAKEAQEKGDKAGADVAQKMAGDALAKATNAREIAKGALRDIANYESRRTNQRNMLESTAEEYARQGAKSPVEEAEAKIKSLVNEAQHAGVSLKEINDAVTRIREGAAKMSAAAGKAIRDDVTTQLLAVSGTAVQQAENAARIQIEQMREKVKLSHDLTDAQKAQAYVEIEATSKALDVRTKLLTLDEQIAAFKLHDTDVNKGDAPPISDYVALNALQLRAMQQLNGLVEGTEEWKRVKQQIRDLDAQRISMGLRQLTIANLIKDIEARLVREQTQRIRDQAAAIQTSVGMATQLAQAFGLMGESTAAVFQNITQVASSIKPLLNEIGNLGKVDGGGNPLATLGSVLGMAGPLIGGVSALVGLFNRGEDPAAIAAREKNTEAIQQLTEHIGDLANSSLTGTGFSKALQMVDGAIKTIEEHAPNNPEGVNITHFDPVLTAAAEALHITLKDYDSLVALKKAMQEADFAAYSDTFAGALQQLNDSFRAYNITDPSEKLRRTVTFLTGSKGIPLLATTLSGLNTQTAEGSTEAITRLQGLLEALGKGDFDFASLGGASIAETRDAILSLIDELRGSGATGGTTTQFGFNQNITEATGSHIAGLLTTGNLYASRTASATESIVSLLSGMGLSGITAPLAASGFTPHIVVEVNLPTGVSAENGEVIGSAVGRGVVSEISKGLAAEVRRQKLSSGNIVIS